MSVEIRRGGSSITYPFSEAAHSCSAAEHYEGLVHIIKTRGRWEAVAASMEDDFDFNIKFCPFCGVELQ